MKLVLQTKKSPIAGAKCELLIFTTETYMKRIWILSNDEYYQMRLIYVNPG